MASEAGARGSHSLSPRQREPQSTAPESQIKRPSLSTEKGPLYFQAPPQLEEQTRPNLAKPLSELFEDGDSITVTDAALPFQLDIIISFTD